MVMAARKMATVDQPLWRIWYQQHIRLKRIKRKEREASEQ